MKMRTKNILLFVLISGFLLLSNCLFVFAQNPVEELGLKLPFLKGESWKITQGYFGTYSHYKGLDIYATDFSLPGETDLGKPILAVTNGMVHVKENKDRYGEFYGYGKYVEIEHKNGFISRYAHLKSFSVRDGE